MYCNKLTSPDVQHCLCQAQAIRPVVRERVGRKREREREREREKEKERDGGRGRERKQNL